MTKKQIVAASTMVGGIIGVGVFAVPYAVKLAGWPVALLMVVVLASIQMLQHLFYAEACIATDDRVRLGGLVERFLSPRWKIFANFSLVLATMAACVAYVLVGGQFLHTLLGSWLGGSVMAYQLIWGFIGAVVLLFDLELVARVNFVGTMAKVVAILAVFSLCLGKANLGNLSTSFTDLAMPYGVLLFAFSGLSAIPAMEELLGQDKPRFRQAVFAGTLFSALLIATFGFLVAATTGAGTTDDSVTGLVSVFGQGVSSLLAGVGFLAVSTAYLTSASDLRESLIDDWKAGKRLSWGVVIGVPLLFVVVGMKSFLPVVSFSGSVFGGANALLVAFMYLSMRKRNLMHADALRVAPLIVWFCITVLASGALYKIFTSAYNIVFD